MSRYRTRSWRAFDPGAARLPRGHAGPLRILGLDPGSRRTGYGVIERRGADWVHVAHGCVTVPGPEESLAERLRVIFEGLRELIASLSPGEVAIERVFVNRNVDSALKLGQARGAALCAVPKGLPVFEYAPRAIKLALVGSGAAEKEQVAHMIRTLLGLQGRIGADAADALAVAVCHAHSLRLYELAAQSERSATAAAAQPTR
ncbi:MAG TPA: crossover junction endodeoxyribonuclease RuvC [Steroidobacteraceae bacterium]|nr:crossover junction endodeoxyribonuclease RuvC [Steroidobacteraceae bacterium]